MGEAVDLSHIGACMYEPYRDMISLWYLYFKDVLFFRYHCYLPAELVGGFIFNNGCLEVSRSQLMSSLLHPGCLP